MVGNRLIADRTCKASTHDYFVCAKSPGFEPVEGDPTLYRKEIIYPGHFVKKGPDGEIEFELDVDDRLMSHWEATHKKLTRNGVEVPLPIEHTNDPERNRGKVVDIRKEFNPERGCDALYMYARFRDAETAKNLSATSNVSLYSPRSFTDGKGVRYSRPIRHVAITDYPLIPQLSGWERIAASIVLSEDGAADWAMDQWDEEPMMGPLAALAEKLGLEPDEGASEQDIEQMIIDAWDATGDDTEGAGDEELLEDEAPEDDNLEEEILEDEEMPEEEMPEEEMPEEEMPEEELSAPVVSASLIGNVINGRRAQLELLVKERKITPAQRDNILKRHGDAKKLHAYALSHDGDVTDGFDGVIETLRMGKPILASFEEATGAQHTDDRTTRNPILADAQRRAERASKQRR